MTIPNTLTSNINEENWALIPSDPAIFDDMIQQYGTRDTKVQELFTLDFDDLAKDAPVHGLIFISRFVEDELPDNYEETDTDAQDIIFTCQVVTNVCGTLALLAVLFNAEIEKKGQIVENFLEFTRDFDPVDRGVCLGNSPEIRKIHDAYATAHHKAEAALNDSLTETVDDDGVEYIDNDDYHYVTYIYKNGFIWELDGLKKKPAKICKCGQENWFESAKPFLQKRMEKSQDNEITFSLMAVTHDSLAALNRQREVLKINTEKFDKVFGKGPRPLKGTLQSYKKECLKPCDVQENVPIYADLDKIWNDLIVGNTGKNIMQDVEKIRERHADLERKLQQYNETRQIAQHDAIRQKFDYFPFLNTLGQLLHKAGLIQEQDGDKKKLSGKAKATKARYTSATAKSNSTASKPTTSKANPKKRKAEMENNEQVLVFPNETKKRKTSRSVAVNIIQETNVEEISTHPTDAATNDTIIPPAKKETRGRKRKSDQEITTPKKKETRGRKKKITVTSEAVGASELSVLSPRQMYIQ